ncbi:MAG: penicillin-binding transpeptidase domain-containing protein [Pseudomonadota bacterium]
MRAFPRLAPHLADRARAEDPAALRHDLTLDAQVQTKMQNLGKRAVLGHPQGLSAAILVADHQIGEILAWFGSPAFTDPDGMRGYVDMANAPRSPGSTLKPFIYGMAFDQGLVHTDTLIEDRPVRFGRYAPQNSDGVFRGPVRVGDALQLSLNIPPLLLTEALGPARLMALMRKAGARPQVNGGPPGLAVTLGGVGMTLRDLVQLYAALPNGGVAQPLRWHSVSSPDPKRIMSAVAAWQIGDILAGIAPPKGHAAKARDIAYKTGTSYGHRDAWALGYDDRYVIGVWLGRPDGTPVPGAFGGDLAAPVLFEAFALLKAQPGPLPPPPAETLILYSAELPPPLLRFRCAGAAFEGSPGGPTVAFPPSNAVSLLNREGLPLKLRDGTPPFTVLVDGAPLRRGVQAREMVVPLTEPGFTRLSVIDAEGRAASVKIRLSASAGVQIYH